MNSNITPRKFRLSFSQNKRMETDEEMTRLYECSKNVQHKLQLDELRVLTAMQKELYQNYAMFEKPPVAGSQEPTNRNSSLGS